MTVTDQDAADAFLAAHPETREVDAFLLDLAGKAYGKRYPVADLPGLVAKGSTMCASMPFTDVCGVVWDVCGMGFSDGDPDLDTIMVPGSLVPVPWAEVPRAQAIMRFWDGGPDGGPVWWEPRTVLEKVVERFAEIGLTPVVAIELEFYLIAAERGPDGAPAPARSPMGVRQAPAGQVYNMAELDAFGPVLERIQAACLAQGLPVTTIGKEYGRGQFEVNLTHVADPVLAADHAVLMRRAVTAVARVEGMDATFMSKPFLPESGSGMQINISLATEHGVNAFEPGRTGAEALIRHAVAGMQAMLAETMAIHAPSFHAFRRYAPDQYTPVTLDWGDNNRSVAFRVPVEGGPGMRLEHRAAGADANPYLVMAAVLAAVHHGITQKLEPTAKVTGNAGAEADPSLPVTLWQALEAMGRGAVLPDYIERRYIDAYIQAKQAEFDAFIAEILPREHDWYL